MKLYKFLNARYGLEAIKHSRIKISHIDMLNDPFDFKAFSLGDRDFRRSWNNVMRNFAQDYGVICMSSTWQNPLLWSHYAENHTGLCLEFNVAEDLFNKVKYVANRIDTKKFKDAISKRNTAVMKEQIVKNILTKFEHWNYENEFRKVCE